MAKKQTRRTVSLSRATYEVAKAAAAREGVAAAEWVTRLIRAACPELPPQVHASGAEIVERARAFNVMSLDDVQAVLGANGRTPPTPPASPTRAEIDAIAYARRTRAADIPAGTLCANCVDARATHRGHVDNTGEVYPLCDSCELPAEERDGYRGYVGRAAE